MARRDFRSGPSFKRKQGTRKPYDRVLIVCEGRKTEPYYLWALRDYLRLANSQIHITGECGSDPSSIVAEAKRLRAADKGFDRVYCVFDRDRHEHYDAAVSAAVKAGIVAITSNPCFEFWILLHFMRSTRPYAAQSGKSVCEVLIKDLEKTFPGYAKGAREVFALLKEKLPAALDNAARVERDNAASGVDNPHTRMHRLVTDLFKLKWASCQHLPPPKRQCDPDDEKAWTAAACLGCLKP